MQVKIDGIQETIARFLSSVILLVSGNITNIII